MYRVSGISITVVGLGLYAERRAELGGAAEQRC